MNLSLNVDNSKEEKDKESRIEWIDIAKGIGIILVVLGHTPRDNMMTKYVSIKYMYTFIYSFHMALFFFLSGVVSQKRESSLFEYIWKKIKSLIVPWVLYATVVYLIIYTINVVPKLSLMLSNSPYALVTVPEYILLTIRGDNPYCIHIWFLLALFCIQVIVEIGKRLTNTLFSEKTSILVLIVFFVAIYFFLKSDIRIVSLVKKQILYYLFGVFYATYQERMGFCSEIYRLFGFLGVVSVMAYSILVKITPAHSEYIEQCIRLIHVFLGTPSLLMYIAFFCQQINLKSKGKVLGYLGRNSYNIYLLHQPFFCAFAGIGLSIVLGNSFRSALVIMGICFLLGVFMPLLIVKILHKLRFDRVARTLLNIKYYSL